MPEYLAPGVYVEETSFRAKSIEGVGTSTTAFVGPTRKGPFRRGLDHQETPEILTSYGDFERLYGGHADLAVDLDAVGALHQLVRVWPDQDLDGIAGPEQIEQRRPVGPQR